MYDEECEELARHFLENPSKKSIKSLAQHIQDAVEEWLFENTITQIEDQPTKLPMEDASNGSERLQAGAAAPVSRSPDQLGEAPNIESSAISDDKLRLIIGRWGAIYRLNLSNEIALKLVSAIRPYLRTAETVDETYINESGG